jgi:hypothetical protein
MMTPTLGRIVLYHEGDWEGPSGASMEWRGTNGHREHPAIITGVWSDTCVNLMVFFDAKAPAVRTSMLLLPDSVFAEGVHCSNSGWRWPPGVALKSIPHPNEVTNVAS